MLNEDDYNQILSLFPSIDFAFSYGSGVFEQCGYDYKIKNSSLPMLDFIFVVKDPIEVDTFEQFFQTIL